MWESAKVDYRSLPQALILPDVQEEEEPTAQYCRLLSWLGFESSTRQRLSVTSLGENNLHAEGGFKEPQVTDRGGQLVVNLASFSAAMMNLEAPPAAMTTTVEMIPRERRHPFRTTIR